MTDEKGKYDKIHAKYYDIVYQKYPGARQTQREIDLIERIVEKYSAVPLSGKLLDIACGTGRHLIPLRKQGYDVDGVDESPWMLKELQAKAHQDNIGLGKLQVGDIKRIRMHGGYTGAFCFFNAFGEIARSINEGRKALRKISSLLVKGGWLLIDTENPRKHFAHWTEVLGGWVKNVRVEEKFDWSDYEDVRGVMRLHDVVSVYRYNKLEKRHKVDVALKFWSADELQLLFEGAGFKDVRIIGDDYKIDHEPKRSVRLLVLGMI